MKRSALVFSLVILIGGNPVSADQPIPQDAEQVANLHRDRLEWIRQLYLGSYEKVGKQDPRWNEPARKALDVAVRIFNTPPDPLAKKEEIYRQAKAAVDAGCNDLLVTYLYCRFTDGPDYPGETESIARMKRVAKGLLASRYSPLLTAMAQYRVGSMLLSSREVKPAFRKEAQGYFDESLALLAKSVASDQRGPVWEEWWYDLLQALLKGYRESGMDGPQALERIEKEMSKTPEVKALQLHFRGNCWLHMGWEARSQAFAPNVPPEQMKTFQQSLEIARSALEESWNLQPGNAKVAQHRLEIEKGIGGDRATMELWFERAMKADSDGYDACWTKLDWLDPKWHGTAKEMLAFGRACRDTKNARAGITLLEAIR